MLKMNAKDLRNNPLLALSDSMASAVDSAGISTVTVDARRRFPASGIAYAPTLVLTANHVVEREEDLRIFLPDGSRVMATLAGRDPASDLAVLRLEDAVLTPAVPAPQEARVGQLVLALGRPSAEGIQASLGVVSGSGGPLRTRRGGFLERYLRTDTIPYPGFSGGPLIDAAGRLLGVNTSGLAGGASLTLPVSFAWNVAQTLADHGIVRRGYLGVRSQPVNLTAAVQQSLGRQQSSGLLLVGVEENSPADKAELMIGDILVGLGGQAVSEPDDLLALLAGPAVGQTVPVEIIRAGQSITIQVKIGERGD
jgi:S1-C subfamily serine protease